MRLPLTAICFLILQTGYAQFALLPLPAAEKATSEKKNQARTKATSALPFWDDFSQVTSTTPSADLWNGRTSTWVNDGLGINPPSIKVATFDGIDSLGRPYSINDVLAKGFADKLESHPIDLSEITPAEYNSVFISFYYQLKGRGELPDAGDRLVLEFRNVNGLWVEIWAAENDGLIETDVFTREVIAITDPDFYHAGFQFRFKNFARLSGPYDTWHLDYIYLNKDEENIDESYPDRTVVSPLTSIFNTYRGIPKKHFFVDKEARLTKPTFVVHNLKVGNNQPVNYFSYLQVDRYKDGALTARPVELLDSAVSLGLLFPFEFKTSEVQLENLSAYLDETADSLQLNVTVAMASGDNKLPADDGDYHPKYAPMDFRLNDTTRSQFWISSFYAYDDGTAEYGAALNQPGAQVAYEFNLLGESSGFINFLQLYFPRFGDETSQVVELMIWKDLDDTETSVLYSEVVTLQRKENNVMWQKKLNRSVPVPGHFYVGWKQSSAAVIAIGLDKNTDSGEKIFYNVAGTWEPNHQLSGSLMIRPVFGENLDDPTDPDPIDGIEEEAALGMAPYPNPSSGTFVVPGTISDLTVRDISGRAVTTFITESPTESTVSIDDVHPGVYIVQYMRDGWPRRCKIMVR